MRQTLNMAEARALEGRGSRIHRIRLRVGALSGVVPEALEFAFEALKQNTIARDGRLEIDRIQPISYCETCRKEFSPEDICYICPNCGRLSLELRRGNELELIELEVS